MNIDFIQKFTKYCEEQQKLWTLDKKIYAGLSVLLGVVLFMCVSILGNSKVGNESSDMLEDFPRETVNIDNNGYNAAIAPQDSPENMGQSSAGMVAMSIEDTGRTDPFLPYNEKVVVKQRPKVSNTLMPPPEALVVDTSAIDVVETQVSGIMYDNYNPSAILKIKGMDYLVRSGDVINGYKVLYIAKDNVTVQNGANVYKAGVGGVFPTNGINKNTISNLESKFGGKNNVVNKK